MTKVLRYELQRGSYTRVADDGELVTWEEYQKTLRALERCKEQRDFYLREVFAASSEQTRNLQLKLDADEIEEILK
jgi:hypothetical protein